MIKIIAVDDSPAYLETLRHIFMPHREKYNLIRTIDQVKGEENIPWLLQVIGDLRPDIVLMDISFSSAGAPHDFGIELVKKVRGKFPAQNIIMLTADDSSNGRELMQKIERSFQAGANAYLSKHDIANCIEAIDEVVNGDKYVPRNMMSSIIGIIQKRKEEGRTFEAQLTARQLEVVKLLSEDKNIQQIADSMRGNDGKLLSIHAVHFHLRNIRNRMKVENLQGIVAKALREGIID